MAFSLFVMLQQSEHLWYHLGMFFRDELLSWSWRRPLGMPLGPAGGSGLNPIDFKDKVSTNVENVIGRINGIAPQFSEEVTPTATPSPPKKKKSCFLI